MYALMILAGLGVLALLSELLNFRKVLFYFLVPGLIAAIGAAVIEWDTNAYWYNRMVLIDNFAIVIISLLCGLSLLWFLFARSWIENDFHASDKFALILFAITGAIAMVCFNHFCMLFLGLEILSLSMYILAGSAKRSLTGNEASLKYFITGSFATGFLLFGIALIYGVTGTFHIDEIVTYLQRQGDVPQLLNVGILLVLVAMTFKISAVPFHFWTPDVYTGSPTPVTVFMAAIVKTAAVVALFRLFVSGFGAMADVWLMPVIVLSILTMLIGNLTATFQNQFKRLLAYSSIAHAGYLLIAVVSQHPDAPGAVFYYTMTYGIASMLAFGILYLVTTSADDATISDFNGLVKRNPLLAAGLTAAMLSLAGIPPLAGFFAKYYLFRAALQEGYVVLVVVAIIASLISIYYYFRLIIAAYMKEAADKTPIPVTGLHQFFVVACIVLLIVLSVIPEVFLRLAF